MMTHFKILFAASAAVVSTGCPNDNAPGHGAGTDGSTAGDGGCQIELPSLPPPGHPDFRGVISGEHKQISNFDLMATGNVVNDTYDVACCRDYAVAEKGAQYVRILFSAPQDGLVFLSDQSDEVVSLATHAELAHLEDIELVDIDGDERTDLVGLRDDHVLAVAFGGTSPPYFSNAPQHFSPQPQGFLPRRDMAVLDLDCDEDRDLVVLSYELRHNGVVFVRNDHGALTGLFSVSLPFEPQHVITYNVDDLGGSDVIVSGPHGEVSVILMGCNNSHDLDTYQLYFPTWDTTNMTLAAGWTCPDQPTGGVGIAAAAGDEIHVMCGDVEGNYAGVKEDHADLYPSLEVDYLWDVFTLNQNVFHRAVDVAIWRGELYGLTGGHDTASPVSSSVLLLQADTCDGRGDSDQQLVVMNPDGKYARMMVHGQDGETPQYWDRISLIGDRGLAVGY